MSCERENCTASNKFGIFLVVLYIVYLSIGAAVFQVRKLHCLVKQVITSYFLRKVDLFGIVWSMFIVRLIGTGDTKRAAKMWRCQEKCPRQSWHARNEFKLWKLFEQKKAYFMKILASKIWISWKSENFQNRKIFKIGKFSKWGNF